MSVSWILWLFFFAMEDDSFPNGVTTSSVTFFSRIPGNMHVFFPSFAMKMGLVHGKTYMKTPTKIATFLSANRPAPKNRIWVNRPSNIQPDDSSFDPSARQLFDTGAYTTYI